MSKIEIRYFTGDLEERKLSKSQPVSVGRHSSNDIYIDEDDVDAMHCRIAWNKQAYELVAANADGVELNGTLVKTSPLKSGDVLRVGTVDIALTIDEVAPAAKKQKPKAATASEIAALPEDLFEEESPADSIASGSFLTPVDDDADVGFFEDEPEDDLAAQPVLKRSTQFAKDEDGGEADASEEDDDLEQSGGPSMRSKIRERMEKHAVRPGDHDVIRSKGLYVIGLTCIVLLLVAGVLWFWAVRDTAEKLLARADEQFNDQKYSQAEELYNQFLAKYPRNDLATEVKFKMGRSRIDRHFSPEGDVKDPEAALKAVEDFTSDFVELEGYGDQQEKLLLDVKRIANGAAKRALSTKQRKYLPMAKAALKRARLLKVDKTFLTDYQELERDAEAVVTKEETIQAAIAKIDKEIEDGETMQALKTATDIQNKYETFSPKNRLAFKARLAKALVKETSLVAFSEKTRDAITKDRPERLRNPRSMTLHVRPQDGRTSDKSQLVYALAKHCLFGVDSITGEPVWRRAVGATLPFFPIKLQSKEPSLLLFDTRFAELVLINRQSGKLIWRQPLRTAEQDLEFLQGPPLVHDGLLYVPTTSNNIYKIDLDSGRLLSQLTFTQAINAPPVLVMNGSKIVVVGDQSVLYTVALTPKMSCETASYTGHKSGDVVAPLRPIGKLVLMCQNDKTDSCRLRVLNSTARGDWLAELTPLDKHITVDGVVRDVPVLRSNKLFVMSSGERITEFSVTDDNTQREADKDAGQFLRKLRSWPDEGDNKVENKAKKKNQSKYEGPIYLVAGPNSQLWMATDRLRKFQSKAKTMQKDTAESAVGRATQPPQLLGQNFYLGRESGFSTAVTFTQTDRQAMQGQWQLTLGGEVLAWSAEAGKPLVCINESGHIFRIDPNEISAGGYQLRLSTRAIAPKANQPFRAFPLGGGYLGISVGAGDDSNLWIVNSLAQFVGATIPIPDGLQADPVILSQGAVLPLPGRLKFINVQGRRAPVADYEMPNVSGGTEQPKWTFLTKLGDQIIAADDQGGLIRVQLRTGGRPNLGRVGDRKILPKPVSQEMAVVDGKLIVADADQTIHLLSSSSLQPIASKQLDAPISNALWSFDGKLFVETGRQRLSCFSVDNDFQLLWEVSLNDGFGLVGPPTAANGQILIAERNGTIRWLNPQTGAIARTWDLGETISHMPRQSGTEFVVPSADGSLHRIPAAGQ